MPLSSALWLRTTQQISCLLPAPSRGPQASAPSPSAATWPFPGLGRTSVLGPVAWSLTLRLAFGSSLVREEGLVSSGFLTPHFHHLRDYLLCGPHRVASPGMLDSQTPELLTWTPEGQGSKVCVWRDLGGYMRSWVFLKTFSASWLDHWDPPLPQDGDSTHGGSQLPLWLTDVQRPWQAPSDRTLSAGPRASRPATP